MELIDRYVEQTVRLLPAEERAEAEGRLRERIRTRLRAAAAGVAEAEPGAEQGADSVPEETVVEVLGDLGPPEEAAASLRRGRDWLIAPHLRRPFFTAVTLSLAGLLVATVIQVLTGPGGLSGEHGTLFDLLLRLVASLDDLLLEAVAVFTGLVALFVVMEHTVEGKAAARRRWTPRDLVSKDPDRVKRAEAILEIALLGAIVAALHFFHFEPGAHIKMGDEQGWVPVLSPVFRAQIAWIDLWLLGTIALDGVLLWRGRWNALLRCASAGLKLVMAAVVWRARQGAALIAVDAGWMAEHGWSAAAIARYRRLLEGPIQDNLRWVLAWVVVALLIAAVVEVARALASAWRAARTRW